MRLPALSRQTQEAQPANGWYREPDQPLAALRTLIIDDNVDAAESLAVLLQALGLEVRTAYDGPSGLVLAADYKPEVVLLDIGLPRMDGYEVARRLRNGPDGDGVLLIALSGYGQDEDRRRSEEAGFDHHLVKPASTDVLMDLFRGPGHSSCPESPGVPARR